MSVAHIRHKSTSQYSHLTQKLEAKKKPYLSKPMLDHVFKNNATEDLIERMNNEGEGEGEKLYSENENNKMEESTHKIMSNLRDQSQLNNTIDVMQSAKTNEEEKLINAEDEQDKLINVEEDDQQEKEKQLPPFKGTTNPNQTYKTDN